MPNPVSLIQYVNSTAATGGGSIVFPLTSPPIAGNLLVAVLAFKTGSPPSISARYSGWTLLNTFHSGGAFQAVYTKIVGPNENLSQEFNHTVVAGMVRAGVLFEFANTIAENPVFFLDATTETQSGIIVGDTGLIGDPLGPVARPPFADSSNSAIVYMTEKVDATLPVSLDLPSPSALPFTFNTQSGSAFQFSASMGRGGDPVDTNCNFNHPTSGGSTVQYTVYQSVLFIPGEADSTRDLYTKENGIWKPVDLASVKDGGVWKEPTSISAKDGGIWKEVYA